MSDYGLKISKQGISVTKTDDLSDLIMVTRYPLAKLDSQLSSSFKTIDISFLTTPPLYTETLLYSFPHGYDYTPQIWGLWNITDSGTGLSSIQYDQAYGTYIANSGAGIGFYLYYKFNYETIDLYIYPYDALGTLNLVGVTAKLTAYIFADDLSEQDYTTDD